MSICAVADRGDHDTFDLGAEWLGARLEVATGGHIRAEVEALRLGDMKVAAHLLGIVWNTGAADVRRVHGAARAARSVG